MGLAWIRTPTTVIFSYMAIFLLGILLFIQDFGSGAQEIVYTTMSYPAAIRVVYQSQLLDFSFLFRWQNIIQIHF